MLIIIMFFDFYFLLFYYFLIQITKSDDYRFSMPPYAFGIPENITDTFPNDDGSSAANAIIDSRFLREARIQCVCMCVSEDVTEIIPKFQKLEGKNVGTQKSVTSLVCMYR